MKVAWITWFLASPDILLARVATSVYLEARKNIGKGFDDDWIMVASMHPFLVKMTYRNIGQLLISSAHFLAMVSESECLEARKNTG